MSISPVGQSAVTSTADTSAKVQLARDQKKLAADIKAQASQDQIAADNAAVVNDELTIAQNASSSLDTFL